VNKGVSISDTRLMFKGIAKQISVMGLTAEQTGRVMQGFSQIMSKGTLSAEELKQQIGESLPTAMGDAATSMKLSMDEFLKSMGDGLIDGVEFMKIYTNYVNGKYSPSVAKALIKTQGQINLMSNRWSALKRNMADTGFVDVVTKAITRMTAALGDPAVIEQMKSMVTTLSEFFVTVVEHGDKATRILKGLALAMLPLGGQFKLLVLSLVAAKEALIEFTGSSTPFFNRFVTGFKRADIEDKIRGIKKEITTLNKAMVDGTDVAYSFNLGLFNLDFKTEESKNATKHMASLNAKLVEYQKQLKQLGGMKPVLDVVKGDVVKGDVVDPIKKDGLVKTSNAILAKKTDKKVPGDEKIKSFREKVQALSDDFGNLENRGMEFIGSFADGLSTQLTEALMTGKASFGDFARSILAMITQMIIKMLIFKAISGIVNAFAGPSLSGTGSSALIKGASMPAKSGFDMGSFLKKAGGGRVKGGRAIMVGEAGREVFVPGEDGRIVPNHNVKTAQGQDQAMTENVNITLNLSTGVQSTVRAEIMGMMPIITKQVKNSVAEARQRGGSFSSRMGVA